MTAKDIIVKVGACWIGCTVLGAGVGLVLGAVSPDFVSGLFGMPVDPIRTGIGLGIVNGGIAGIVIGILVVLVEAFGKPK